MTAITSRKPMPRKPPVKRAFSGVVGLPPEPEIVADPANPVPAIEPEVPKSAIKNRPPKSAPIAKQSFRTPRHWIPDMPGPYCLGQQSSVLQNLNTMLTPIAEAGPDQQGFGAQEL